MKHRWQIMKKALHMFQLIHSLPYLSLSLCRSNCEKTSRRFSNFCRTKMLQCLLHVPPTNAHTVMKQRSSKHFFSWASFYENINNISTKLLFIISLSPTITGEANSMTLLQCFLAVLITITDLSRGTTVNKRQTHLTHTVIHPHAGLHSQSR